MDGLTCIGSNHDSNPACHFLQRREKMSPLLLFSCQPLLHNSGEKNGKVFIVIHLAWLIVSLSHHQTSSNHQQGSREADVIVGKVKDNVRHILRACSHSADLI